MQAKLIAGDPPAKTTPVSAACPAGEIGWFGEQQNRFFRDAAGASPLIKEKKLFFRLIAAGRGPIVAPRPK